RRSDWPGVGLRRGAGSGARRAQTGMNFRCFGAIAVVCGCALPVRAEYISVDELEQMRFASKWSDAKPSQTPHPAVVRVIATDRNSMSLGSGTLVDANE